MANPASQNYSHSLLSGWTCLQCTTSLALEWGMLKGGENTSGQYPWKGLIRHSFQSPAVISIGSPTSTASGIASALIHVDSQINTRSNMIPIITQRELRHLLSPVLPNSVLESRITTIWPFHRIPIMKSLTKHRYKQLWHGLNASEGLRIPINPYLNPGEVRGFIRHTRVSGILGSYTSSFTFPNRCPCQQDRTPTQFTAYYNDTWTLPTVQSTWLRHNCNIVRPLHTGYLDKKPVTTTIYCKPCWA